MQTYGFSIIITERCNLNCSYCHFFDHVSRKSGRVMSRELLDSYYDFICYFDHNKGEGNRLNIRYSGGDPIVLGADLFKEANRCYEKTKISPYFLTGGNGLEKYITLARESHMSACLISIENPLNPDKGAMDPYKMFEIVKKYDSRDFRLFPGVTVVRNEDFSKIEKICNIFYEEIGALPKIQEINFDSFVSPTDKELQELYENLCAVIEKYKNKAYMDFFSYISPVYNATHHATETFLTELNFENKHNIGEESFSNSMKKVFDFIEINYPKYECIQECDWKKECTRLKWVWMKSGRYVDAERKMKDYCRLKKTINKAYYDSLVGIKS